MKQFRSWFALALVALIAAFCMGSAINEGTPGSPPGSGGGTTTTTASGTLVDSIKTAAVKCFGAEMVVWTVRGTTGKDSLTMAQVSQDSTHWFKAQGGSQQDNADYIYGDGVSGDSLKNGPHTCVLAFSPNGVNSTDMHFQIPARYARLLIVNHSLHPITGLVVTCRAVYPAGTHESDYGLAYTDSP